MAYMFGPIDLALLSNAQICNLFVSQAHQHLFLSSLYLHSLLWMMNLSSPLKALSPYLGFGVPGLPLTKYPISYAQFLHLKT